MTTSRRAFVVGAALAGAGTPKAATANAPAPRPLVLNDASRLNPTPVSRAPFIADQAEKAVIDAMRRELTLAKAAGRPVCLGGARHSMGGQSLPPAQGVAVSLIAPRVELDTARGVYRAAAGARWRDVIAALDPHGFSPAVMQSNNDFSLGGTISVNAHGWPVPSGPVGSTVRSLRLLLAGGTVVDCSSTREAELFRLAIGGYGLFGALLSAELAMVPNRRLKPRMEMTPADVLGSRFAALVREPGVSMAYGRLSIARRGFLEDGFLVGYRATDDQDELEPARRSGPTAPLTRKLFRGQIGADWIKDLRWGAETGLSPVLLSGPTTRNSLLNTSAADLGPPGRERTDILHEYFLPPERLAAFLAVCREAIPPSGQELANVTIRYVDTDEVSRLAYAPAPRVAVVMFFSQRMWSVDEAAMQRLTGVLIEAALGQGGSFYLPYRLHASRGQVRAAYPALAEVIEAKRRLDPGLLFRNQMWDRYFAG
jgi:FAD/FMN-containing dehydrogenase